MNAEVNEMVNSTGSIEQQRARRVIFLRQLAGLSRKKLQDIAGISASTLQHWEENNPGISYGGVKRYIAALAMVDVLACEEWIMYGIGMAPVHLTFQKPSLTLPDDQKDKELYFIQEELALYKRRHPTAIDYWVVDQSMAPFYKKGDLVAGCRLSGDEINNALGKDCIVFTNKGEQLLRHLAKGSIPNTYTLETRNSDNSFSELLVNVELMSVAPISFHRKLQ